MTLSQERVVALNAALSSKVNNTVCPACGRNEKFILDPCEFQSMSYAHDKNVFEQHKFNYVNYVATYCPHCGYRMTFRQDILLQD